MFVFEDVGWIALTTVAFILFNFLFEKILHFKGLVFLNVMFWRLEIISGIYYGFVSLAIEALIWHFGKSFTLPTGVLTSLALVTLRSPLAAVINIFPSLIFYTLMYDISILTYILYGITMSAMLLYVIIDQISSKAIFNRFFLGGAIIIASMTAYFIFLIDGTFSGRRLHEATILFGIFSALVIGVVTYIVSAFKSANILFDSVTFAYYSFYRHAVAWAAIQNLIKKEKIKHGVYVAFKYQFETNISNAAIEDLTKQFLLELEKALPSNALPFVIEQDLHGIFFPLHQQGKIVESLAGNSLPKRKSEDILRGIEKLFHKVEREYFSSLGERSFIKTRVGASFYGLQDSSLSKLEQNAIFAVNSVTPKSQNTVALYNHKELKNALIDSKSLLNMDTSLSLDNFENELMGVYSLEKERLIGVYSQVLNASEFNLINSVREHIKLNGWVSEFDRYFAVNTIQEFTKINQGVVMFNYSPLLISKNLDFNQIEGKVAKLGISSSEVVFIIDEIPKNDFQFANIKEAKRVGFKIALQDITSAKIIDLISPDWIIISPENYNQDLSKYRKFTIFGNISSLENLKLAKKNGALYYSGVLLQEEDISKNLDISSKKSKITLKQLINETKQGGNHE